VPARRAAVARVMRCASASSCIVMSISLACSARRAAPITPASRRSWRASPARLPISAPAAVAPEASAVSSMVAALTAKSVQKTRTAARRRSATSVPLPVRACPRSLASARCVRLARPAHQGSSARVALRTTSALVRPESWERPAIRTLRRALTSPAFCKIATRACIAPRRAVASAPARPARPASRARPQGSRAPRSIALGSP
jgi:hypothetical protein